MKKALNYIAISIVLISVVAACVFLSRNYGIRSEGNLSDASYTPPVATTWGTITGTIASQSDLQSALNGKFGTPNGSPSQYVEGNGALTSFPTNLSVFTNGPGYITSASVNATTISAALGFTPYNAANPAGYLTSAALPATYVNGTLQANPKTLVFSGTLTSGSATFYMTVGGTSGGTSICSSAPASVTVGFDSTSSVYGSYYSITGNKLVITASQSSATGVISLLGLNLLAAPVTAPTGTPITATVVCS